MNYYTLDLDFATPGYDEAVSLRNELLRMPLKIEFSTQELIDQISGHLIGLYNAYDDTLIGCALLLTKSGHSRVKQVCIHSDFQGKGFGVILMNEIEEFSLRQLGISQIVLHARKNVIGFYRKIGYYGVDDIFHEVGIPHLKMIKELN